MPVVSSRYWNMVHGNTPDEVRQDKEGLQIMRTLGNNMAWLLKCIELGRENGVSFPEKEPAQRQILSDRKRVQLITALFDAVRINLDKFS